MKQRILIVDDAAFIRSHLRELAEKAGFEVVAEAEDASGAIEAYRTHRPDAVTMDVVMPGNGIHAIEEIMAIDAAARILVVTAVGQKKLIDRALEAGAKMSILKPVRAQLFIERLERLLED